MSKFLIVLALLVLQMKWSSTWILDSLNICLPWCSLHVYYQLQQNVHKNSITFSLNTHLCFLPCSLDYTFQLNNWHTAVILSTLKWKSWGEEQSVICIIHCLQYSNPTQLLTVVCFYNIALRPGSVCVAQLSWVTALYSYVTYEVEKCPRHAQNEYTVGALSSIKNKVYRLQQKRKSGRMILQKQWM